MGSNGGGKSRLIRAMIGDGSAYSRGVVLDTKGDFKLNCPHTVIRDLNDWRWKWYSLHPGWILYRPTPEWNNGPALDELLRRLFERGRAQFKGGVAKRPFLIVVDEGLALAKTGSVRHLGMIAVSGRALGIGLWVASQRPRWIPIEVRSESWRWYVFALSYTDDDKEVSAYTKGRLTVEMLQKETKDFEFFEIRRRGQTAADLVITHFPKIELKENAA